MPTRTRYIGIGHPAWPDPLDLGSESEARAWYADEVDRFPDITVDRIDEDRTTLLPAGPEPGPPSSTPITVDVNAANGGTFRITYERPGPVTQIDVEHDLAVLGDDLSAGDADIEWAEA